MLKIIVCVKQVPGTTEVALDPETGVMMRSGVNSKLNPYDLYALEQALLLRDELGGKVITLTMGPEQAKEALLETLAMGADEAVLLSDRRLGGADVLATSRALAEGIKLIGDYDLIFCGKQTTDGDTAQVGPALAEHLGLPHVANVYALENFDAQEKRLELKAFQDEFRVRYAAKLPLLIAVDGAINTPRLPSYRRYRELEKRATEDLIPTYTVDDFEEQDEGVYGLKGSPTQVVRIFTPRHEKEQNIWEGDDKDLGKKLFEILDDAKQL